MKLDHTPIAPLGDPSSPLFWIAFLVANAACLVLFAALFV